MKDSTGAVLPGAAVTVTNEQTGAARQGASNEEGFYQFLGLVPGHYTVEAELGDFKRYKNSNLVLTVDQNLRADVLMELGAVTESVQVSAQAAAVDTRSSSLSGLVDDRRIVDLPINNRNVIGLAALLPGVTQVSAPSNSDVVHARNGPTMAVNGNRANQMYSSLNGTYFNNPSRNTGLNVPPPDAVQEFRIQTSNFSADSGRNAGAIVNVVTRAGTNDFHGSLWEFHRNSALNARNFFEAAKPKEHQNQFGVAAGGPLKRDRVFLFGAYEGTRDRRAASEVAAFPPTAAERAGDFSSFSGQLVDPFSNNAPFANNQIPASRFDPAAVRLLQSIPVAPAGGRLTAIAPAPRDNNLMMLRNDWTISPKQTLYAHYYLNQTSMLAESLQFGSNIPGWMGREQRVRNQNAGFNHTYVISPNLLNQATLGYTRSVSSDFPTARRTNEELLLAGLPNYTEGGATQFRVPGRIELRAGGPVRFLSNNYDINETLSWIKGRHTMKFGFQHLDLAFYQSYLSPPSFTFNGARSGNSMADFMLGAYRNLSVPYGVRINDSHSSFTAGFFQDDFKVNSRLTLNFGLRYEMPKPWYDKGDRINTIDTTPGAQSKVVPNAPPGLLFVGDLPRTLVKTDRNNFAPRFGFAWDVMGDGKTAVRGAYGIFYDTLNGDSVGQENPPFAGSSAFVNGVLSNPLAGRTAPPVFPDAKNNEFIYPINSFFIDLGLRTPYIQQWNLSVERQVGRNWSFQASYVGNTARKLAAYRPFNVAIYQPGVDANGNPLSTLENAGQRAPFHPGIYGNQMVVLSSGFNSNYNGFQFRANKRFADSFSVMASYTMGKAIDENSTTTLGGCVANPYDLRADRGRSQFDSRHTMAVSWMWTPVQTKPGFFGRLLGGWNLSGIHRVRSGYPITMYNGDDVALGADICGGGEQHPDLVGDPSRDHESRADMVAGFFNAGAFRRPQTGHYGSAGRNILSGPAFVTNDFAILKDFVVFNEQRFQFRAELYNALNQVNFTSVRNVLADPRFGQINGAGAGRGVQFGLKYLW